MKKWLSILLIGCLFLFCACGETTIEKASKNVNNYNINLVFDDQNKTLSGKQSVDYINQTETTLTEIAFACYANAFSENVNDKPVSILNEHKAYPNGKNYGQIVFEEIKVDNLSVEYEFFNDDKTLLKIPLGKELFPNQKVVIYFCYQITLANINHRLGYGENTINFGNFFPIACVYENGNFVLNPYSSNGDPFYSDISNFEVTICYDKKYIISCTGNEKTTQTENLKTTKSTAKAVRDFVFVLSDKFEVITTKVGDTIINYYFYDDENHQKSLETAANALTTFNNLFGKYPYSVLNVVKANFVHGGMEYPNLVMIADNLQDYDSYLNVIVHEIGHQWWYGVVGNNQYAHGWLDEGLTEYATAVFYENNDGYNATLDKIVNSTFKSYSLFDKVYTDVFGSVDSSMTRSLGDYKTETEYVYVSYVKGMLLFDSLRKVVGDKDFFKALKIYYKTYSFQEVKPENLIHIFEKTSGKSLENFFSSWINGKVVITALT